MTPPPFSQAQCCLPRVPAGGPDMGTAGENANPVPQQSAAVGGEKAAMCRAYVQSWLVIIAA